MSKTVGVVELGQLLGVNPRTIRDWTNIGCPIHHRARAGEKGGHQYVVKDVVNWMRDRAVADAAPSGNQTIEEAKRRKILAEAASQEIDLAKKKGEVIALDQLERKLSNTMAQISATLRRVPDRTAMRLVGETDEDKIKKIILSEIDIALISLADFSPIEDDEDEDEQDGA